MLKRNECTMEELKEKILNYEKTRHITEKYLEEEGIVYFPCSNGTLVTNMYYDFLAKLYLLKETKMEKMTENEFENMAKKYVQMKKDLEAMEATFEAEKVRGLFMKTKHM